MRRYKISLVIAAASFLIGLFAPGEALAQTVTPAPSQPTTSDVISLDIALPLACPIMAWVSQSQSGGLIRIDIDYPAVPPPSTCLSPPLRIAIGSLSSGAYGVQVFARYPGVQFGLIASGAFVVNVTNPASVPGPTYSSGMLVLLVMSIVLLVWFRQPDKFDRFFTHRSSWPFKLRKGQ